MNDTEKDKRVLLMLKIWYHLIERKLVWPAAVDFLERRINEELGNRPDMAPAPSNEPGTYNYQKL